MDKIDFVNAQKPALNDENLNKMQDNIERAINAQVSGDTLPIGAIMPYSSDNVPENWLLADGQEVSRTDYNHLFATIGTLYGEGDGSTTFNLPNLYGKVVVGQDENDADFNEIGKSGGEKTHTLTTEEMPSHTHSSGNHTDGFVAHATTLVGTEEKHIFTESEAGEVMYYRASQNTGGGQAHNNLQPYMVQNYIIKAKQSAGLVATVVDSLNSESETDALSAKKGKDLYSLLIEKSKEPIGEFNLWQGNLHGVEDGTFKEIAICYSCYNSLLSKFPLREGFTRKYKLAMEYTNTNIATDGHMFLQFANFDTNYSMKEYLFDNVWGSVADGTRKTQIQDFDIETIKQVGHFKLKVTPTFNSQAEYRIYRIYLIIYDELE